MYRTHYSTSKHCRWDGKAYEASKPHDRDGFCCTACKQAHHRAIKKYETTKRLAGTKSGPSRVTTKKSGPKRRRH